MAMIENPRDLGREGSYDPVPPEILIQRRAAKGGSFLCALRTAQVDEARATGSLPRVSSPAVGAAAYFVPMPM